VSPRPPTPRRPPRAEPALLLLAAVAAAPLAIGGVHAASNLVLASLTCAVLGSLVVLRGRSATPPWPVWIGLGVLAWIAASLLPLPAAWEALLPATARELWNWEAPLGSLRPTLSADPGSTTVELIKLAGGCAALWSAACIGDRPETRRLLAIGVIGAGLLVVGVSLAQTVTGTDSVLWWYAPRSGPMAGFRTPFVNANHGAQFLELCGLLALGAAFASRGRERMLAAAAAVPLLGGALATGCRSTPPLIALGVLFLIGLARSRAPGPRWPRWAGAAGAAALVTATSAWAVRGLLAGDPIVELGGQASRKLGHLPRLLEVVGDHPWTGIGRGAFHAVFPMYEAVGQPRRHLHAESEVLHLVIELGIPVALVGMATVAVVWTTALARWRREPAVAGALVATGVVAVHALWDFGLEFAGVGLPFAVVLGLLIHPRRGRRRRTPRWIAAALAVACLAPLLAAPVALRHGSIRGERQRLIRAADGPELDEALASGLRWHPRSSDFALVAFERLRSAGRMDEALDLLGRAMYTAPADPIPHLAAAETFSGMGLDGQAALEARLALDLDAALQDRLFPVIAPAAATRQDAERYLGPDPERLAAFAEYLLARDPDSPLARDIADGVATTWPTSPGAARLRASMEWAQGDRQAALRRLREAAEAHPQDVPLVKQLASRSRIAGDPEGSLAVLERAGTAAAESGELLYQRALAEVALGRYADAHQTLLRLQGFTDERNPGSMALLARARGELAEREGHRERARAHYLESLRHRPHQPEVRWRLALVCAELDLDREALEQFERVRATTDAYPAVDDRIQRLRAGPGLPP